MNFANKISTARILSVPFFIASLIYYTPEKEYLRYVALVIFALAVVSDAVDGYIARKSKDISEVGLILDPLGDKLLLTSSFICLYFVDKFPLGIRFPLWVTLIVISRDTIILLGVLVIYLVKHNVDISPSGWGKLTTISQMAAVLSVLIQWEFAYLFWSIAAIVTVISGADYVRKGFRILYAGENKPRNHR